MTKFDDLLESLTVDDRQAENPFSAKKDGVWIEATISVDFLNEHFSQYSTVEEMKNATDSEGLKLYFDWLKQKGILN